MAPAGTGAITCTWTDHPGQRHKAIRQRDDGGLNVFRHRYRVPEPLRLHSRDAGLVDEVGLYARFRERSLPTDPDGLHVLLAGELSYHPERVLALAERGVRLSGLWTPDGLGYHTVGPLPFGHVTDLPRHRWREALREARPDIVYAQLDWRAVPFALEVLRGSRGVPFVWHFKESPQRSLVRGEWPQLAELCTGADAVVLSSPEERDWFELALPGRLDPAATLVLDGSLPKADWFAGASAPRHSDRDGEVHTAVLGRPVGFDAAFVAALAAHGVHLHFHGLADGPGPQGGWRRWLDEARHIAPRHVHVHPGVDQRGGGCPSCHATTRAGCTACAATTAATFVAPPGRTSTTRPASAPSWPPGCRCSSRPARAAPSPSTSWCARPAPVCCMPVPTTSPSSSPTRTGWRARGRPSPQCGTGSPSTPTSTTCSRCSRE